MRRSSFLSLRALSSTNSRSSTREKNWSLLKLSSSLYTGLRRSSMTATLMFFTPPSPRNPYSFSYEPSKSSTSRMFHSTLLSYPSMVKL